MGLSFEEKQKLVIAGLIHDLGVFYLNEKFSDLSFDNKNNKHAMVGYKLSKGLFPDKEIPEIIKYHHHKYSQKNQDIPLLSHVIHLADRIAVLIKDDIFILDQKIKIENIIKKYSGNNFWSEGVNGFIQLSKKEYFWLDVIASKRIEKKIDKFYQGVNKKINLNEVLNIANLMSHIIDFRSPFTATHSRGLAIVSSKLAGYLGFNKKDCKIMKIAEYFHDIGKLIVPVEILNKPDKLNKKEWNLMKTHTYFTYHSLNHAEEIIKIKQWAAYHHEKLNGNGYPFHISKNELSKGARIMGVADVFTAIKEDRPYRKGMSDNKAKKIISEMSENNNLDKKITSILIDNYEELNID